MPFEDDLVTIASSHERRIVSLERQVQQLQQDLATLSFLLGAETMSRLLKVKKTQDAPDSLEVQPPVPFH